MSEKLAAERLFLALALPFGIAFVITSPPFDPSDERVHFYRAFLVSEGSFMVPGIAPEQQASVPHSLTTLHRKPPVEPEWARHRFAMHLFTHDPSEILALMRAPFEPEPRDPLFLLTPYSPIVYAPQAAGIFVGRQLGLSAAAMLYIGRLANLLAWIAVTYFAIRLVPVRKWTLVVLCLSPMSLYLASSISADAPTNAISLAAIALMLHVALAPGVQVTRTHSWALACACALLPLVKPGYWPLALLVLFIPAGRFRGRRHRATVVAAAALAVLLTQILWLLALWVAKTQLAYGTADPVANFESMLRSPLSYLSTLGRTFATQWLWYLRGFVGLLGHTDVRLPGALYVAYPAMFAALAAADGGHLPELDWRRRAGLGALFLLCVLSVMTVAYIGWHHPAWSIVLPVQGRYFIPVIPLFFLALPARWQIPLPAGPWAITAFCSVGLTVSVYSVVRHYFLG